MDYKVKHLEMIQAIITRLAGNSFQIKQWALVILGAIWGLAFKNEIKSLNCEFFLTGIFIVMSWYLSSYYLQQERLFRKMYDIALVNPQNVPERLVLTPSTEIKKEISWVIRIMWSRTQLAFFGVLSALNIFIHWDLIKPHFFNLFQHIINGYHFYFS